MPSVAAVARFGPRPSGPGRFMVGDDVDIWVDFINPATGAPVDASGVSIAVWSPTGANAATPTITRERFGTWRTSVPASIPGEWRAEISCSSPGVAVAPAYWSAESASASFASFEDSTQIQPGSIQMGGSVRVHVVFSGATGAPAAVGGVDFAFRRQPNGTRIDIPSDDIIGDGLGVYYVDFVPPEPGEWYVEARCATPTPEAVSGRFTVIASRVR